MPPKILTGKDGSRWYVCPWSGRVTRLPPTSRT